MILLLIVFSLLIYVVIRSALVNQFDTAPGSVAQILAAAVEIDPNGTDIEIGIQQMPEFTNPDHPMSYQVWKLDGEVIIKALGGTCTILLEPGGIFTTKVTLPADNQKTIAA
jgi:hypothetical protein